ncbi:MAG: UDP-N-acetylglucosamine 2-epimerase (non-hydrolyzing) [Balneolia bacterium]|nr:UDP-N-acetylglucosamine 2-epimerase (non-hydrolyzing) [Balneolia bacterium]
MKDIVTIVGARPQFVKAAVVSKALSRAGITEELIHTGQHYDAAMSRVFFDELGIPAPAVNLETGSGTHGKQTADILEKVEDWLLQQPALPKALMVYGDTNSTLAGALAAAKLHIPVVHVEAGLRSFNRRMPEEINRVMTDHISDLLFCSSDNGVSQLVKEGITKGVHNTGDVMYDAVRIFSSSADDETPGLFKGDERITLPPQFYLFTLHRPSNTDSPANLQSIMGAIRRSGKTVVWPVHPRVRKQLDAISLPENLITVEPQPYLSLLKLLSACEGVLTDSGGLQKEAYWLKKRCITLRDETEWTETLDGGWNQLAGAYEEKILAAIDQKPGTPWKQLYGNGHAADHIARILGEFLS